MLTCALNSLTEVIQQFSNNLPHDILGPGRNPSFQVRASLTHGEGRGRLEMVTGGYYQGTLVFEFHASVCVCVYQFCQL